MHRIILHILLALVLMGGLDTIDADMVILKSGEIFQTPKAWTEDGVVKYYEEGRVVRVDDSQVERLIHSPTSSEEKVPATDVPPPAPDAGRSISSNLPAGDVAGYLDLKWGQPPTGIDGLVFVGTDPAYGGVQQYSRKQEHVRFGRASVDDIVYGFWQDGLYTITVWTSNFLDFRHLKAEIFRRFGKGMQNRAEVQKYFWIDNGADRLLSYDDDSDTGYLWMRSRTLHSRVSARYPD